MLKKCQLPSVMIFYMKKALLTLLVLSPLEAVSAPIWTNGKVNLIFGGYPDNSIAFSTVGPIQNPAGCNNSSAYAVQADHDTKAALSILLAAKMADKMIHFSVRDDVCHAIQQTDVNGITIPVIQRIAIE